MEEDGRATDELLRRHKRLTDHSSEKFVPKTIAVKVLMLP
jgi:hypothetical protein